jgi:hypothetical protein
MEPRVSPKIKMKFKIFWFIIAVLAVPAVIFLGFVASIFYPGFLPNYAQEVAKPLEVALKDAGATRQCIRGDNGRGWDNDRPGYSAIYEVPGGVDHAEELLHRIAKDNGFDLTEEQITKPVDAGSEIYQDNTKASRYPDLQSGVIELGIEIYEHKIYAGTGDQFCAVVTPQTPVNDKTTVWIGVNLPAFKR